VEKWLGGKSMVLYRKGLSVSVERGRLDLVCGEVVRWNK
jgi:hypothetical protein